MGTAREKTDIYYYGFDYIRAIGCLLIVAMHSNLPEATHYANYDPLNVRTGDVIFFQVYMLAVPLFFIVSLFLSFRKLNEKPGYFIHRLRYLISLYLFWTAIYLLLLFFRHVQRSNVSEFVGLFTEWGSVMELVMTGGGGIYYFFFSLIFLYVSLYLYMRLVALIKINRFRFHVIFLFLSLIFVQTLPLFSVRHYLPLTHWNPLSFIPYIFLVPVLGTVIEYRRLMNITLGVSLLMCFATALLEWKLLDYYHISEWTSGETLMPTYARLSIISGSTAIFTLSFRIKSPPPKIVQILSKYSLGIYTLHAHAFLYKTLMIVIKGHKLHALGIAPVKNSILFITRLVDSVLITLIMKRNRLFSRFV